MTSILNDKETSFSGIESDKYKFFTLYMTQ